jgi:hypothetical protein
MTRGLWIWLLFEDLAMCFREAFQAESERLGSAHVKVYASEVVDVSSSLFHHHSRLDHNIRLG